MLILILQEMDGSKFLTVKDATELINKAYEAGKLDGRLEEAKQGRKDLEEMHARMMKRLDQITI
jgi:hypothetical protein